MRDDKLHTRLWARLIFKIGLHFSWPVATKFGLAYMPYASGMRPFEKFDWTRNKVAISKE